MATVTGTKRHLAIDTDTLNTGQGANELYDMDQNVLTTSGPTFANVAITNNVTVGGTVDGRDVAADGAKAATAHGWGNHASAGYATGDNFDNDGTFASLRAQGTTAGDVGLGNATNESKATMFAGPTFTGNAVAPTPSSNDNSTKIATTAYVQTELTDLIGGAPGTLDTLNELAAAINDDDDYSSTLTTALALKAPKASPTFTGTVAIPNIANVETAITANTAKTGITSGQASAITANTAKTGITSGQASAITANTAKTGITSGQASAITANTAKTGITSGQASAITANTAKTGITSGQASAITANTAKTGITSGQASAITANTAKRDARYIHYPVIANFNGNINTQQYVPLSDGETEGTSITGRRDNFVAPCSGEIYKIVIRSNASLYDRGTGVTLTGKLHNITDRNSTVRATSAATTTTSATNFKNVLDFSEQEGRTFVEGDRLLVSLQAPLDAAKNYYVTVIFKLDQNSF